MINKETSVLFRLPLKMLVCTIIISSLSYFATYRFFENSFREGIRHEALEISKTVDWALMPLLKEANYKKDEIEKLFQELVGHSIVKKIRIYDLNHKVLFSSNHGEEGIDVDYKFIDPIIKDKKLIKQKEDFKKYIYEVAIPLRERNLRKDVEVSEKSILYVKIDFREERLAHYRFLISLFIAIGLFTLVLLLINNYLIKYYILNPVTKMKEGLKKVSKGKYEKLLTNEKGKEVNDLIRVFNKMVEKIEHSNMVLEENKVNAEILAEAKGAFLSNMTHELRTPLNSVIGYSELLLEEEEDEDKNIKLRAIIESGTHLLSIINNVLDFSKIEAQKLKLSEKVFDVRKTFRNIESLFKIHSLQRKVDFVVEVGEPFPDYLKGDEGRIKQILINLISNSFKFTNNGQITLRTNYDKTKEKLYMEVIDTGAGMKKESLKNIFNSFEQVDIHHKGTGLGLSITKALCELMNGKIDVTSEVGVGTKFALNISIKEGTPKIKDDLHKLKILDDVFDELKKNKKENHRKLKILVAEDIEDNQLVLKMMLKKLDVELEFADNGKIAIEKLRENNYNYDLFLLDIQMPVMSGLEVLDELRRTDEITKIYVIALTAYSLNAERSVILEKGAKGIMTKPISKDKLRTLVANRMKKVLWSDE